LTFDGTVLSGSHLCSTWVPEVLLERSVLVVYTCFHASWVATYGSERLQPCLWLCYGAIEIVSLLLLLWMCWFY